LLSKLNHRRRRPLMQLAAGDWAKRRDLLFPLLFKRVREYLYSI
jgi:hypothetical protein